MSVVSINGGRIGFGDSILIEGIAASVHPAQRIGLVGPNGSGKTTLLRAISGDFTLDAGSVQLKRGARIGILRQSYGGLESGADSRTLYEEMEEATAEIDALSERISELSTMLATGGLGDEAKALLLGKLGSAQHRFEVMGGYERDFTIRRVLAGVGFSPEQYGQQISTMSGGQRQKALLARLLLEKPDLLLLDEPSNHLDLDGRKFLEDFLLASPSAVIVVSHDRYFLNRVAQYVWEIDAEKLISYRGNYDAFRRQRLERIARQREAYEAQREYIERTQEYIRRNIAGQNTRQAQGRRKLLARLSRMDAVKDEKTLKLSLSPAGRTGEEALRVESVTHGFGGKHLFEGVGFSVSRGDKLGIIGPNGCGKSTLLSIIAKKLKPLTGKVTHGANVQPGYLAQESGDITPGLSVMDEMRKAAPGLDNPALRSYLAKFLFCGEDVSKIASELSGGEKRRLALAKLLYLRPNLLLLDEPTNHFDIPSFEMLEAALSEFAGTVILVSHDRTLLDAVATKILAFTPDGAQMCEGNYTDYLAASRGEDESVKVESVEESNARGARDTGGAAAGGAGLGSGEGSELTLPDALTAEAGGLPEKKPARRSQELERQKRKERMERRAAEIESKIADEEGKYGALVGKMSDPEIAADYERLGALTAEIEAVERELARLYGELEEETDKI